MKRLKTRLHVRFSPPFLNPTSAEVERWFNIVSGCRGIATASAALDWARKHGVVDLAISAGLKLKSLKRRAA